MSDAQCRALIQRAGRQGRSPLAQMGWEYAAAEDTPGLTYWESVRLYGEEWARGYREYWG